MFGFFYTKTYNSTIFNRTTTVNVLLNMPFSPFVQFYKDCFLYIFLSGIVFMAVFDPYWGFLLFCFLGPGIGVMCFHIFKKNKWYTYYNLGIKKQMLLGSTYLINLFVSIPVFVIGSGVYYLFHGASVI